jgi:hypothetical protein
MKRFFLILVPVCALRSCAVLDGKEITATYGGEQGSSISVNFGK